MPNFSWRRASPSLRFICLLFTGVALAGEPAKAPQPPKAPAGMEFEQYQLVLLVRGPRALEIPEEQLKKLQVEHLAHLSRMAETGKLVIAGPFSGQKDESFRGMCLYRVPTLEEARKLAEEDPMVKAGRLRVEVMTWNVEKGYMVFPKAPKP